VIVFADISERRRAEWALRASETQLKAIIENTSAAIYVKRRATIATRW
jgi:PAS domain-containing protein